MKIEEGRSFDEEREKKRKKILKEKEKLKTEEDGKSRSSPFRCSVGEKKKQSPVDLEGSDSEEESILRNKEEVIGAAGSRRKKREEAMEIKPTFRFSLVFFEKGFFSSNAPPYLFN